MSEPKTPNEYLARAGETLAKGIGVVAAAIVALFALIWIGGSETGNGPVKTLLALMILIPIYFFHLLPPKAASAARGNQFIF